MKLFDELAAWWPNIAGPDEYRDEALFFGRLLRRSVTPRPRTLLHLGSGSGNNAFPLNAQFELTCVDLSPHMHAVACEWCTSGRSTACSRARNGCGCCGRPGSLLRS